MSASTDFSVLVDAVDFSTVSTGVLGVAAALIVVYITIKGVKLMTGFVRGDDRDSDPYDGTGASGLDFSDLVESSRESYERSRRQG